MEIPVLADVEFFRHRAGPGGVVFRPAVDAGRQGDARGHGVKSGIGIHPHGIGPQGLGKSHHGHIRAGFRYADVPGQHVGRRGNGQTQLPANNGGRLADALVTHAVIQQRVDKHADTRAVFPRGGIGFKALPGHFGHDVIQAGIDGLNVGKRHHTHPVIDDSRSAAPCLGDAGQRQHGGRDSRGLGGQLVADALYPLERTVLGNTQAVDTRQGLLVGHKDVAVAHGVFDAETVGVHVIRHLLCHDRIFDLVGRPRGGLVTRRGPVDLVPVLGVVVSGHIDGVPLLDLQQGHYRRIGQGVLAARVAAVCQLHAFFDDDVDLFHGMDGRMSHSDALAFRAVAHMDFRVDGAQVRTRRVGQAAGCGHLHPVTVHTAPAFRQGVYLSVVGRLGKAQQHPLSHIAAAACTVAVIAGDALGKTVLVRRLFLCPHDAVVHSVDGYKAPGPAIRIKPP